MSPRLPLLAALLLTPVFLQAAETRFVDPARGADTNTGADASHPWKSFAPLNATKLGPGDRVIVAPGIHEGSLAPHADATAAEPAVIEFLPGTHEFAPEKAIRRPLFVSNSCDAPTAPKPFGILVENCRHLRLTGAGVEGEKKTLLLMGGRMIEAANLNSDDIAYRKLVFDLKRPTVSEFRVIDSAPGHSDIRIAEGSTVEFKNGKLAWTGDLGTGAIMSQQAVPKDGRCWRVGLNWIPFDFAKSTEDLGGGKYRLNFKDNYRLRAGDQFQFRHIFRDSVGIHNARSRNILFEDCDVYALTNMGIVSQFTENITYRRVRVAPPKGTIRTCPAWADVFHFSNCKGALLIEDCVMSGTQDDPVNCHGTHLRIVGKPAENSLRLRYMQPQTYGFAPYIAGDEIAVIDHNKLRELPDNPRRRVTDCVPAPDDKTGHEWIVTLDGPAPSFGKNDVVDNITWQPDLTIRGCHTDMNSCRAFLITTRGKVLVENCAIGPCAMPGILVEDDARGWFESSCIRDMTIRNNRFVRCGIEINPQTVSNDPKEPVHENIRITDNIFDGGGISAKGVKGLVVTGNKTPSGAKVGAHVAASCSDVKAD